MVFCAYCGKSFTRKEHLERHIPSHTNVKPHRCSACQLSFARRDLLQRHHSTYHEARDPMDPLPGGVPTIAGRTPIACQSCASAKTGCDKRVPCSRCVEKNLPCAARFARRSSKAAVRAAQASAAMNNQLVQTQQSMAQPQTVNPAFMDVDPSLLGQNSAARSPGAIVGTSIDPRLQDISPSKNSQANSLSPEDYSSPQGRADGFDSFLPFGGDFIASDPTYQDLMVWPEYQIDLDMYPNPMTITRADIAMPSFTDLSDMSSTSEPMTTPSSSRGSFHTRGTSIVSTSDLDCPLKPTDLAMVPPTENSIPEFEVVIAAEAAWPLARCNPPTYSGACPRTAIVHLECLEQKCKQDGTWTSLEKYLEQVDWDASDLASVVPLTSRTRDKMLAITQSFLHKALEIHRGGVNGYSKARYASPGDFNFIVLPPSKILEYFLRSYIRSLSDYYPLVAGGCVDPNEMLHNNQASTLLVLLMIAQGAAAVPTAEARCLSAGLTETCRISLFDIIEKDVELSADSVALRCALIFTALGAWSGDKWLMDISMGQRGMYLSMLKHAGMLEAQPPTTPTFNSSTSVELQWRAWLRREGQNRLVYNWVMLDQELSLFHDTAPMLSITELQCQLPGPELLWMAPSSDAWLVATQSLYGCTSDLSPPLLATPGLTPSLYQLFQDFLDDHLSQRQGTLSPQQMRLLLHPLQSLLCHLRQMLSCLSDVLNTRRTTGRTATKASTLLRLEEVQTLLQRWYELSMAFYKANPDCPVTRCNIVLYHLISLNAITSFPDIERLARREGFGGSAWDLSMRYKRCIYQREEAIFHCGQALRLLRCIPADRRPNWWPAATYRAVLILWADSVSHLIPKLQAERRGSEGSGVAGAARMGSMASVAVDQVTPEDPAAIAYLWGGDGVAVLTRPDGSSVDLEKPAEVLSYGIKALEEAASLRVAGGIRRKFIALSESWNVDVIGGDHAA